MPQLFKEPFKNRQSTDTFRDKTIKSLLPINAHGWTTKACTLAKRKTKTGKSKKQEIRNKGEHKNL